METLEKGTGLGNDFLGWLHLPSSITQEHLADLKATARYYARIVMLLLLQVSVAVIWEHVLSLKQCQTVSCGYRKRKPDNRQLFLPDIISVKIICMN